MRPENQKLSDSGNIGLVLNSNFSHVLALMHRRNSLIKQISSRFKTKNAIVACNMWRFLTKFLIQLTCPSCQIGDIADQVVGQCVDRKGVLNAWYKVAHENLLNSVFIERGAGYIVALRNIFRSYIVGVIYWPPFYHVGFDSTFWPRPLQCHVCGVDNRSDVQH